MEGAVPTSAAGQLVAATFWPATVLGIIGAFAWRRIPPGRLRTRVQIAAALLVLGPHPLVMLLRESAADTVVLFEFVLTIWSLGALWMLIARPGAGARSARGLVGRTLGAIILVVVVGVMGPRLLGDVFGGDVRVAGEVTAVREGYRALADEVLVDGERYRVTRDIASHLRPGVTIEARARRGSRFLHDVVVR